MLNSIAVLYVRWLVSSDDPVVLRDTSASVPRTAPIARTRPAARARRRASRRSTSASSSWWRSARWCGSSSGARASASRSARSAPTPTPLAYAGHRGEPDDHRGDGDVGRLRRAWPAPARSSGTHRVPAAPACSWPSASTPSPSRCSPGPTPSPSSSPPFLWGSMLSGAGLMQQETGLSIDAVRIIQALVLLFVAADVIVRTIFRLKADHRRRRHGHDPAQHRLGGDVKLSRRQTIGVALRRCSASSSSATWPATSRAPTRPSPSSRRSSTTPARWSSSSTRRPSSPAIGVLVHPRRRGDLLRTPLGAAGQGCARSSPRILFIPLVIVLSLALSDTGEHQRHPAARRVAAARHAHRPGRDGRPVVRALGRRQHRHRGDDAHGGGHRLHDLRARSATRPAPRSSGCPSAWRSSPVGSWRCSTPCCACRFRVDQIISGVVINLLALGVTGFIRSEVIVPTGVSIGTPTPDIALPGLSEPPDRRRPALHRPADLLLDVRRRRASRPSCCSARRSGCGCGPSASTPTPPRPSAST